MSETSTDLGPVTAVDLPSASRRLGGHSARSVRADLESDHLPRLVAHDVLRDADGGYEAGANMDGLLSVVDATLDRFGDSSPLATGECQPGERDPPGVGGLERAGDTDI